MLHLFKLLFVFVFIAAIHSEHVVQEGAKFVYQNKKYLNGSVFTKRLTRGSNYLSSGNLTTVYEMNNNITCVIEFMNIRQSSKSISLELKLCDLMKMPWAKDWLVMYSDCHRCPVPPGTWYFRDFVIPPKNFPIPLSKGNYRLKFSFYTTSNRIQLGLAEMGLNINNDHVKK